MNNTRGYSETPKQSQFVRCEPHRRSLGPEIPPQATSGPSLDTSVSQKDFWRAESIGERGRDKFVDSMASLPSASEGLHLGFASGTTLPHITDTKTTGTDCISRLKQHTWAANRPTATVPFALKTLALGQLEPFVDAYFSLFHPSYPIVHEATFRAQFMEVIPRPARDDWQALLFIIAAVGAWATATEQTDIHPCLFEAAKARLSIDMLEMRNPSLVQALALLSNFMEKINMPNSGYNLVGLVRRIAMGIGLYKNSASQENRLFNLETRRRIWHCIYIFDVSAIVTFFPTARSSK
ncbi:Zn(II)2Cys6 transcription factor [Penicillium maclennaniae]|uniref:Zn(II)2Cys6 transcription factor n=1 Tax=Penicillium maclennaniae TaxID=1343394 RepID=UPI0025426977|nr:Zn(II)2Cys6 transcription factor [Penicillium maclennaniae]KAJ5662589.1 Zn(II)2Cys6 transcription factor [Penicillium maclennaniae]